MYSDREFGHGRLLQSTPLRKFRSPVVHGRAKTQSGKGRGRHRSREVTRDECAEISTPVVRTRGSKNVSPNECEFQIILSSNCFILSRAIVKSSL